MSRKREGIVNDEIYNGKYSVVLFWSQTFSLALAVTPNRAQSISVIKTNNQKAL